MTYKFVTIEDFKELDLRTTEGFLGANELVTRLLSERDAYRSMLNGKYSKQEKVTKEEYEKRTGTMPYVKGPGTFTIWSTDWDAIDAEAARIVEGK